MHNKDGVWNGVLTCVFVEVDGSFEKKHSILQCPGMVCSPGMVSSPPVVSKCLGEAHRRLELFTLHYITLHYITLHYIKFFFILLVI